VRRAAGVLFAGCLCAAGCSAAAEHGNVQFSAQAVQTAMDGESRKAQVFVGDNQVRLEYNRNHLRMVEIYDMKNHRLLLMVPQTASYMLRRMPEGAMGNPMLPPAESSPCTWVPAASCRVLGSEPLFGRRATKWEMVKEGQERSLHWMDNERHMPLRQEWPDGGVYELRPAGLETLNGRRAERWEMTVTQPDGKKQTSTRWYDPELQIVVREELPDGKYRELRNIRVGAQAASLFEVPAGYQRIDAAGSGGVPATVPPGAVGNPEQRGLQQQPGEGKQ